MPDLVLQVAHVSQTGPPRLEVVKDLRQRSAHDPAPVRRQLVVRPERQPGPLDPGEIGGGAIEGHLLVVARPLRLAGGLARAGDLELRLLRHLPAWRFVDNELWRLGYL